MKTLFTAFIFITLTFQSLSSQSIFVEWGSGCAPTTATLNQTGSLNGKPVFTCNSCFFRNNIDVSWDGSRWELSDDVGGYTLLATNTEDTPNPPCSADFTWTKVLCDVTVSGSDCSTAITAPSAAAIPTLGEWGLICLLFIFLIIGTKAIRQIVFVVHPSKIV